MTSIDTKIQKRALFAQEFRTVIETKNILSDFATKLIATAKTITSPFTSVGVAKSYTGDCKVPFATQTIGLDELVLDRHIGNAIKDCKEELSYSVFDVIASWRGDLYASIMKKQNQLAVTDILADATNNAVAVDLSTKEKVVAFLVGIEATVGDTVGLKQKVDGATVTRCKNHGKAFLACGSEAFVTIKSAIVTVATQSNDGALSGKVYETPYGVALINLGSASDNAKRLIYGVAGVPTIAYREDMINVDMGEMVSVGTQSGTDLDLANGDSILQKTWYMSADTKGKNGIFSNVASLVTKALMA